MSIPFSIISALFLVIKIYLDLKKVRKFLTPVVTSNFIRAIFLTNNNRIVEYFAVVNKDGMSFDLEDRTYIVDKKCIWNDEKRRPSSFYFPEIPNPVKLNPEKTIDKFMTNIRDGRLENNVDSDGEIVDISFSSTNLQLYKKSKIFDELNKNPSAEKMQLALMGIIVFLIIVVLIAIIL